jgi:hypothetical protein
MNEWELGIVFALGNLAPLFTFHLLRDSPSSGLIKASYCFLMAVYFMLLFTFFIYFADSVKIRFFYLAGATFVYAAFLFLVLSEMMISGLASALTKWRGEVWVKELDYIYLLLGACGLAMSISRLDIVSEKLSFPEYIGPFVLATALAIRAIKTRVEINGWNKLRENA